MTALLVLGATSVGFATTAANETAPGARFREASEKWWAEIIDDLAPEQQEQVKQAGENHRAEMQALREEFRGRADAAREAFLDELPEEVREKVQEKMAERQERRGKRMGGHGKCFDFNAPAPEGDSGGN